MSPSPRPQSALPTARGELCLRIIGARQLATHVLADTGDLVLGRDPASDVVLEDASVAPAQAILHLGARLRLTSLVGDGSTRVRDQVLGRGETVALGPSELVHLGGVILMVQQSAPDQARRIGLRDDLAQRIEEACADPESASHPFALLQVELPASAAQAQIEAHLGAVLRQADLVGVLHPGTYRVLLRGTDAESAARVLSRMKARLADLAPLRVGMACYPLNGRSSGALNDHLNAQLGGPVSILESAAMDSLQRLTERVAASSINVLILGETGVGKEMVAQQLHRSSPRAAKPFLGLNGAALSETLLESELFGHERGAFTGAVRTKPGLLEAAEGGTVFLDEVGELPLAIQAKLLRVLETRQVLRVGSVKPVAIDVRFVAATNADLHAKIECGEFRQDLFFRLNGVCLRVPPLRERTQEISGLVGAMLAESCGKSLRAPIPRLTPDAWKSLINHPWPGNIRQLRNAVEHALLVCDGNTIDIEHFPEEMSWARQAAPAEEGAPPAPSNPGPRTRESLLAELEDIKSERIRTVLAECAGNQTRAARVLGISRRTLVNRMKALGIAGPRQKPPLP